MVLHIASCSKAFCALFAYKRALIHVNQLMDFQVLLLTKAFIAASKIATVRLVAIVNVHVPLQSNSSVENLLAVIMWTDEPLGAAH